jgi:hypothetical protein
MSILNKAKWIIGVLLVFGLIIATNLIDKKNFQQIRDSVVTIYEDRLLAKEIIFDISTLVHEKEMAIALSDTGFFQRRNAQVNEELQKDIEKFEQTELTRPESYEFKELKRNLSLLQEAENSLIESDFEATETAEEKIKDIKKNLTNLSGIQISEGKKHLFLSKRAAESIELYTQLEIYFLIALAIIVQIIILYNPKTQK